MSAGMARNEQKTTLKITDADRVALVNHVADTRRAGLVVLVAVHSQVGIFLDQFLVAANMVPVVVGVDNGGEIHPLALDRIGHRSGFRGVDHAGLIRGFINDQIGIVVGQNGDGDNFIGSPCVAVGLRTGLIYRTPLSGVKSVLRD